MLSIKIYSNGKISEVFVGIKDLEKINFNYVLFTISKNTLFYC